MTGISSAWSSILALDLKPIFYDADATQSVHINNIVCKSCGSVLQAQPPMDEITRGGSICTDSVYGTSWIQGVRVCV